jgi:hypothetical protein
MTFLVTSLPSVEAPYNKKEKKSDKIFFHIKDVHILGNKLRVWNLHTKEENKQDKILLILKIVLKVMPDQHQIRWKDHFFN